jgi:hypothetical protein
MGPKAPEVVGQVCGGEAFRADEVLFHEGDVADRFYVIVFRLHESLISRIPQFTGAVAIRMALLKFC